MKKWNIPTDRDQKVDEKNGVICLVIMFTSRVMVIKMPKMFTDASKNVVTGKIFNYYYYYYYYYLYFKLVQSSKILIKTNHPVDTIIVSMLLSAQKKM